MFKKKLKEEVTSPGKLNPLDEIRQEEGKVTSKLLQAQQQAEAIRKSARQRAEELKQRAQQDGARDGGIVRDRKIAEAQSEAGQTIEQARAKAKLLAAQSECQVDPAVQWAERVVLSLENGGQTK